MSAILMDTHALIWFANGDAMAKPALDAILLAQQADAMFVSPISAWEASLASRKRTNPADLGGLSPAEWFRRILEIPSVRLATITRRIALEAAEVPPVYGSGDPGDCFLIATARVKKVPLVTRDAAIVGMSQASPGYLKVVPC